MTNTTTPLLTKSCREVALHSEHDYPTFIPGLGDALHMVDRRCPGRHLALNLRPSTDDLFDRTKDARS